MRLRQPAERDEEPVGFEHRVAKPVEGPAAIVRNVEIEETVRLPLIEVKVAAAAERLHRGLIILTDGDRDQGVAGAEPVRVTIGPDRHGG